MTTIKISMNSRIDYSEWKAKSNFHTLS